MTERTLVGFNMTRDEIPPRAGFDPHRETPFSEAMANEDLRITNHHDGRFENVLKLALSMMELANPGMMTLQTDVDADSEGHILACTVTVMPRC
jgi:hypothetical protein